jgi:type II secretory pathway pseudopilin PulG
MTLPCPRRRRRDRGFSLLVVLLLIIAMLGVAATVIVSTQQNLSLAGQDREALQAFYAAEYAVAQAKDELAGAAADGGLTAANFAARGGWTPILQQLAADGASAGCATGPTHATPRMQWRELDGGARWRFCVHNDVGDLSRLDPSGVAPASCAGVAPETCDARDPLHLVTLEAWGAVGVAVTHLSVDVGDLSLRTARWAER